MPKFMQRKYSQVSESWPLSYIIGIYLTINIFWHWHESCLQLINLYVIFMQRVCIFFKKKKTKKESWSSFKVNYFSIRISEKCGTAAAVCLLLKNWKTSSAAPVYVKHVTIRCSFHGKWKFLVSRYLHNHICFLGQICCIKLVL